jgi:hypothetical protein
VNRQKQDKEDFWIDVTAVALLAITVYAVWYFPAVALLAIAVYAAWYFLTH